MLADKIAITLYQIGAIKFGDFTLKSGQKSNIYIDLRRIIAFPDLLSDIAEALWQTVSSISFDLICGVPYTALPIATCISVAHHIPMVMRRKEKKEYGTKQLIEGIYHANQTCLIVEDLITTGSSVLETAAALEEVGIKPTHAVMLIDREQGGFNNLSSTLSVHPLFELSELLCHLSQHAEVKPEDKKHIEALLAVRQMS